MRTRIIYYTRRKNTEEGQFEVLMKKIKKCNKRETNQELKSQFVADVVAVVLDLLDVVLVLSSSHRR